MAFRLPSFNLTVNIWRTTTPLTNPPDVVSTCNLSPGRLVTMQGEGAALSEAEAGSVQAYMIVRLPANTDIRDGFRTFLARGDTVEIPAGTLRYYYVWYVDDIAKGFTNEHRFALVVKADAGWPEPIP